MVNSVTSGGGGNIAQLVQQTQPNNGNPQTNPLSQTQQAGQQQHAHKAPAPTVNTQGQLTGVHVNTTA
jgi:hypothetical protein